MATVLFKQLECCYEILNTVQGYCMDFITESHQHKMSQYTPDQDQLILEEVIDLLKKDAVAGVTDPNVGYLSNLFYSPRKMGNKDQLYTSRP